MTNMRASSADEDRRCLMQSQPGAGHRIYREDEMVEVTPKSLRLRKKVLQQNRRPKRWRRI